MRAAVPAPRGRRDALLIGRTQDHPALNDIGRGPILILRGLARIGPLHRVTPVGPGGVGEAAEGCHPEVVPGEWNCTIIELLVIRVRRDVADPRLRRPCRTTIARLSSEYVEG